MMSSSEESAIAAISFNRVGLLIPKFSPRFSVMALNRTSQICFCASPTKGLTAVSDQDFYPQMSVKNRVISPKTISIIANKSGLFFHSLNMKQQMPMQDSSLPPILLHFTLNIHHKISNILQKLN